MERQQSSSPPASQQKMLPQLQQTLDASDLGKAQTGHMIESPAPISMDVFKEPPQVNNNSLNRASEVQFGSFLAQEAEPSSQLISFNQYAFDQEEFNEQKRAIAGTLLQPEKRFLCYEQIVESGTSQPAPLFPKSHSSGFLNPISQSESKASTLLQNHQQEFDTILSLDHFLQTETMKVSSSASTTINPPQKLAEQPKQSKPNLVRQKKNKQQQLLDLKQQAVQREKIRQKRIQSVLFIQKWARGFLARRQMTRRRLVQFKAMRKLRRLLSVAYGKRKTRMIYSLVQVLKAASKLVEQQQQAIMDQFLDHCAAFIQKHIKRFLKQRDYRRTQTALTKIQALTKGWKLRRALYNSYYQVREIRMTKPGTLQRQIKAQELLDFLGQFRFTAIVHDQEPSQIQWIDEVDSVLGEQQAKETILKIDEEFEFNSNRKPDLDSWPDTGKNSDGARLSLTRHRWTKPQAKKKEEQKADNVFWCSPSASKQKYLTKSETHFQGIDEPSFTSKQPRVQNEASAQPVEQESILKGFDSSFEAMWPSNKPLPQGNQESALVWPSQQRDESDQAIFWPSAGVDERPGDQKTIWPSEGQTGDFPGTSRNQMAEKSESDFQLIWPSNQRNTQKTPHINPFSQPESNISFEDFPEVIVTDRSNQEENQPDTYIDQFQIKHLKSNKRKEIDPTEAVNLRQTFGNPMKHQQQINPQSELEYLDQAKPREATHLQSAGNDEDIPVPEYDFEQMLSKALEQENASRGAQSSQAGAYNSYSEQENETKVKPKQKIAKNREKQALLEKRKQYDPRKAAMEGRKIARSRSQSHLKESIAESANENFPDYEARPLEAKRKSPQDEALKIPKQSTQQTRNETVLPESGTEKSYLERSQTPQHSQEATIPFVDQQTATAPGCELEPKPREYLKRKTQAIKPQKINWQNKPKIDCWTTKPSSGPSAGSSTIGTIKESSFQMSTVSTVKTAYVQPAFVMHSQSGSIVSQSNPDEDTVMEEIPDENIKINTRRAMQIESLQAKSGGQQIPAQKQFLSTSLDQFSLSLEPQSSMLSDIAPNKIDESDILHLDELDKVFALLHKEVDLKGRNHLHRYSFAEVEIREAQQETCIPRLKPTRSVFFKYYNEETFDAVYDDLKNHYQILCNDEPE